MNNAFSRYGFALATEATAIFFASAPHAFAEAMTVKNIAEWEIELSDLLFRIIHFENKNGIWHPLLTTDDLLDKTIDWKIIWTFTIPISSTV